MLKRLSNSDNIDTARGPPGWTVFTKIPTPFGPGWNLSITYRYPCGQDKPCNGNLHAHASLS